MSSPLLSGDRLPVHAAHRRRPRGRPDRLHHQPPLRLAGARPRRDAARRRPGADQERRARRWLMGVLAVLLLVAAVPLWDLGGDVWERRFLVGGDRARAVPDPRPGRRSRSPASAASRGPRWSAAAVVALGRRRRHRLARRATTTSTTATRRRPRPSDFPAGSRTPSPGSTEADLHDPGSPWSAAGPASSSTSSTATTSPTTSSTSPSTAPMGPTCRSRARRRRRARSGARRRPDPNAWRVRRSGAGAQRRQLRLSGRRPPTSARRAVPPIEAVWTGQRPGCDQARGAATTSSSSSSTANSTRRAHMLGTSCRRPPRESGALMNRVEPPRIEQ